MPRAIDSAAFRSEGASTARLIPPVDNSGNFEMLGSVRKLRIAVATAAIALLTACGGGGGGNASPQPAQQAADRALSALARSAVDTTQTVGQLASAATRRNSSGVTRSANLGSSSVLPSTATVERRGSDVALKIARDDGSSFELNSSSHAISPVTPTDEGGWILKTQLARAAGDTITLAEIHAEWGADRGFWNLGVWLHLEGGIEDGNFDRADAGAFAGGSAFERSANLPTTGTAAYSGEAAGLYMAELGTDSEMPDGSSVFGIYSGNLALSADFGATQPAIEGRIDGISISGVSETPSGVVSDFLDESVGFRIALGPVAPDNSGRFDGGTVRVTHPTLTVSSSSGTWDGMFSRDDADSGSPVAVIGTLVGEFATSGGTSGAFLGPFFGR